MFRIARDPSATIPPVKLGLPQPGFPGIPRLMTRLCIATWNINSLRLRLPLLERLIAALDPDVICLQETKVPDALFPDDAPAALGYPHVARRGMKGYNGVAILSRVPLVARRRAGLVRPRRLPAPGGRAAAPSGPVELHDFYVPAGGDVAGPGAEPEVRPQAGVRGRGDRLVRRPPASAAPCWSAT